MFGRICSWFGGLFDSLKSRLCLAIFAVSVGIVALSSGEVFAQGLPLVHAISRVAAITCRLPCLPNFNFRTQSSIRDGGKRQVLR